MLQRLSEWAVGALMLLVLIAVGPVAGTLALTGYSAPVSGPSRVQVQPRISDISDRMQNADNAYLQLIQSAPTPPAASEPTDTVPVTDSQKVTIEWGNWVKVLLEPLQAAGLAIAPLLGSWILLQIPAWARVFIPASRVNQLVENAVKSALASVSGAAAGKTLTIPVTNAVVRQAVIYMLAQAPDVIGTLRDSLPALIQKVLARLPDQAKVPPGYTIDKAIKDVTAKSVVAAAKKQGSTVEDPVKKHLGA